MIHKVLSVIALVAIGVAAVDKAQYTLQRSFDDAAWEKRATFVVSRTEGTATARFKLLEQDEGAIDVASLETASLLRYRVIDEKGGVAASAVTTPCALVRGFEALSSRKLKLPERIGVVVGNGVQVTGLQFSFSHNTHHNAFTATECDMKVLSLFGDVSTETSVFLVRPIEPKIVTKFEDGPASGAPPQPKQKEETSKKESGDKDAPQEDNRTFFEKYWLYIVMFGVWSVINSFLQPKGGAAAQGAAKK